MYFVFTCHHNLNHLRCKKYELQEDICKLLDEHLEKFPNRSTIIFGDFNQFDVRQLETDLSLKDIVTMPTRGQKTLDHVLISDNLKLI